MLILHDVAGQKEPTKKPTSSHQTYRTKYMKQKVGREGKGARAYSPFIHSFLY
jgi:hypothetical protein